MVKRILFLTVLFIGSYSYSYSYNYQDLLFQVYTNNIDTDATLNIKILRKKFYLPLEDLVEVLTLDIKYIKPLIKGNYFNKFNMQGNISTGIFKVNDLEIRAAKDSFITLQDQLFIESTFLEKLLNINISFIIKDLVLHINSSYKFPSEIQKAKLHNREYILSDNNQKHIKADYTKYKLLVPWFSTPLINLSLYYNKDNSYYNNTYILSNLALGMIFMGLDTKVYNTYSRNIYGQQNIFHSTTMNLSKQFINNKEYLRYLEIGDITSRSTPLINRNSSGRGVFISSDKSYDINENKTVNINGYLKDGWDVELYDGSSLIAYQSTPNKQHFYEFNNIPVYNGSNYFSLVFYGPFGEIIKQEKVVNLANSPVKRKQFAYTMSFFQYGKNLFDKQYYYYKSNEGGNNFSTYINLYYGIFDSLSFNFNYTTINNTKNVSNFFTQGLIFSWRELSLEAYIAEKTGYSNVATNVNLSGNVPFIGNFNLLYNSYNKIMSPLSMRYNLFYLKSSLEARYNKYFNLAGFSIPINIRYEHYNYLKLEQHSPKEENIFTIETSKYLGYRTSLNLAFDYSKQSRYYNYTIHPSIISRINNFSIQGDYQLSIYPTVRNNSFMVRTHYYFNNSMSASLGANFLFHDDYRKQYYFVAFSKNTNVGSFVANFSLNNAKDYIFSLYYNVSLGYISARHQLITSSRGDLLNNSTLVANMVIEDNSSRVISNNVVGAKLIINSTTYNEASDKKGQIIKTGLQPYKPLEVIINFSGIDNIMLMPKFMNQDYHLILRPSTVSVINVPFVFTGHIEGSIQHKIKDCKIFKAELINNNTKQDVIKTTTVEDNGLFTFENVPYGKYKVKYICRGDNTTTDQPINYITVNKDINYLYYNQ